MASIVICVYPMAGPINATRKLARDLRTAGHNVHYVGFADCAAYLVGESFFPVFKDVFPPFAQGAAQQKLSRVKCIRLARELASRAEALVMDLVRGSYHGFDALVNRLKPDLMVVEVANFYGFLWDMLAFRFGIPVVLLNDCLTSRENPLVPPITSDAVPSSSLWGILLTKLRWKTLGSRMYLRNVYSSAITGWNLRRLAELLATGYGFPLYTLEQHEKFYLHARAPEVVLMPEGFDFPHLFQPDRHYSSLSVDLTRAQPQFPWDELDPALPVVYCSLGTAEFYPSHKYRYFFECVIRAFNVFSESHQLVVATCLHCEPTDLSTSRNVVVVKHAPQIELLKRSVLMITHAGSNSVRECIALGVPMLLYPLGFDQFGLAARAVFHGLGLRAKFTRVSSDRVQRRMKEILTHSRYHASAKRMQEKCAMSEEDLSPAMCIQSLLDRKIPGGKRRLSETLQTHVTGFHPSAVDICDAVISNRVPEIGG